MNEQANNQATTVEILIHMQEELREKMSEVRGEIKGGANPITKVLGEFRKANPPSFVGSQNPIEAQNWMNQLEKTFGLCNAIMIRKWHWLCISWREKLSIGGREQKDCWSLREWRSHGKCFKPHSLISTSKKVLKMRKRLSSYR